MGCEINGSCCKVCPGIWIAGALMIAVLIQSVFFPASSPTKEPSASSTQAADTADSSSSRE